MRRKSTFVLMIAMMLLSALFTGCAENSGEKPGKTTEPIETAEEEIMIVLTVSGREFTAALENNETARAFAQLLPMTLDMTELNGNEKYHYLMSGLPAASQRVGQIQEGDLMLFGSECVVLFYESFPTGYSYTRLGKISDTAGLREALGRGDVQVSFSLK